MHLDTLKLDGFRNLQSQGLVLCPRYNIFHGENGSGKTSLLEAVYLLSSGRSFRTRIAKNYVRFGGSRCTLFGETYPSSTSEGLAIGIEKTVQGRTHAKVNGQAIASAQSLSTSLPCHVFYSGSFELFEGGPSKRRGFYDWLVFHVKHPFRGAWQEYNRCLKQRNSLLRRDKIDPSEMGLWHKQLSELGERIAEHREALLEAYLFAMREYSGQCGFDADALELVYLAGWDRENSLCELLETQLDRDRARGYTSSGPHKSDLLVTYHGRPVVDTLSRGQMKTLIAAMHLARIACFKAHMAASPVVLVDDLPSELDENNLRMALNWLKGLDTQVLLTCVSAQRALADALSIDKSDLNMFHVKHGNITLTPLET